jgi:RNA polymerase sigma-70 factor (ECF subfamily)
MATSLTAQEDFERLLKPHQDVAYRYALRLTGNADAAMDLMQDAVILAFRAFDSFEAGSNFRAWFFRIITNRFYRVAQQNRRHAAESLDDAPDLYLYDQVVKSGGSVEGENPSAGLIAKLDQQLVRDAVDKLPEDFRVVAILHYMSDMPYEDVAATLEIPVGTVRSRLHRARKQLQVHLWQLAVDRGYIKETNVE